MDANAIEALELELLLEAIYQSTEEDFRSFDRALLRSKLQLIMQQKSIKTLSAMQDIMLHNPVERAAILCELRLRQNAMFYPPSHIYTLRHYLQPWLHSHAIARVWIAECACAEDVFTLIILLEEEKLNNKTMTYVTSSSDIFLAEIQTTGIAVEKFPEYQQNYLQSGGKSNLENYVTEKNGYYFLKEELQRNITWSQFSVVTGTTFNEFELISCRNALVEFDSSLRLRTLRLFADSLTPFGILDIEPLDDLTSSEFGTTYEPLRTQPDLYRRSR